MLQGHQWNEALTSNRSGSTDRWNVDITSSFKPGGIRAPDESGDGESHMAATEDKREIADQSRFFGERLSTSGSHLIFERLPEAVEEEIITETLTFHSAPWVSKTSKGEIDKFVKWSDPGESHSNNSSTHREVYGLLVRQQTSQSSTPPSLQIRQ